MQTKQWHEMGFCDLFVSVNLTARQLHAPDFEQMVIDILKQSGLPPAYLNLEVTESNMIQDPENVDRANHLLWAAHNLERTGDRIVNICERVVYTITGNLTEMNNGGA